MGGKPSQQPKLGFDGEMAIEEEKPLFAFCDACGKGRYIPPTLPYFPIVKNKEFYFQCWLKTGNGGCDAPLEDIEVEFNKKEKIL